MRKRLTGAGIGLLAALLALALGALPFVEVVELKTYDWRMRVTADPEGARNDIVLVTIDEESIRGLEPLVGRWPWPRMVHAQLLNFLARGRPRAVLYDVLFTEQDRHKFFVGDQEMTGTESDRELSAAATHVPVIFPGNGVPEAIEGGTTPPPLPQDLPGLGLSPDLRAEARPVFVAPIPDLCRASRVVAHNFAVMDPDGPWRRYVPLVRYQERVIPSLAVATAAVAAGTRGDRIRTDDRGILIGDRRLPGVDRAGRASSSTQTARRALIRYRGRRENGDSAYSRISFYKLFYAEQQLLDGATPLESPERFRDKIVVVGATAPALDDVFTVPVGEKMSGGEVHATVVDNILSQHVLSKAPRWAGVALTIASGVVLGIVGALVGSRAMVIVVPALWAVVTAFAIWQFRAGQWYPLITPLAALVLATFGDTAYKYFVEGQEKRRVARLFSRYVSKDVFDQLMKDPSGARLGGQRRRMTVMFSDIRGFTSVSEKGEPEAIVAQLNEYFSRMVPVVLAHRGTVDKFVGDMIMALFGAPLDDDAHADHAVETALAMSAGLAELNRQWAAAGRPTLDIGIGINTGDMVAGNLGSEDIMSYTVIGDQVNLGARLESLNKDYQTRVIISGATRAALKRRYDIRALGEVVVKGKSVPVKIFAVVPPQAVLDGLNAVTAAADISPEAAAALPGRQESGTS